MFITRKKLFQITLTAILALGLNACTRVFPDQQYWQRTNTSKIALMRGPKAQQILHRDIQNCVNELRELERLKEIEDPIQTSYNDRIMPTDPLSMKGKDGTMLLSGQYQYNNFDGCMYAKGWERTQFVPYNARITSGDLRRTKSSDAGLFKAQPSPYENATSDSPYNN